MDDNRYLQRIFQSCFPQYSKKHSLPLKQLKAATAFMSCKTEALGSSIYECKNDHSKVTLYHSCRHRSCPQCAAKRQHDWLEKQQKKLLHCTHYHAVFTLPHEYLDLWQYNSKWMTQCLFKSVKDTLFELLKDQKHLGAMPGIIMALHSWGRQLNQHPHVHCLITAGGLDAKDQWVDKPVYLLPIKAMKIMYRGKFQSALLMALENGELHLPPKQTKAKTGFKIRSLYKKAWAIDIQRPYAYGDGVIKYLSRYISGGPLKAVQIQEINTAHVSFSYKDHRSGRTKALSLKMDEFIRRILWHVADMRTHQIRHYGLYSTASKKYHGAVEALKDRKMVAPNKSIISEFFEVKCQHCHEIMTLISVTTRRALKRNSLLIRRQLEDHGQSFQQGAEHRQLETEPP